MAHDDLDQAADLPRRASPWRMVPCSMISPPAMNVRGGSGLQRATFVEYSMVPLSGGHEWHSSPSTAARGQPLTRQIYERIRDLILSGALAAGSRMLSTRAAGRGARACRATSSWTPSTSSWPKATCRRGSARAPSSPPGPRSARASFPDLSAIRSRGFRPFHTDLDRLPLRPARPHAVSRVDLAATEPGGVGTTSRPWISAYSQPEGRAGAADADRPLHRRLPGRALPPRADPRHRGNHAGRRHRQPPPPARDAPHLHPGGPRHAGHPAHRVRPRREDRSRARGRPRDGRGCAPAAGAARRSSTSPRPTSSPWAGRCRSRGGRGCWSTPGRAGAYVVEDDYDSEFRYDSPPISSIQGLDPRARGLHRDLQQDPLPVPAHRLHRLPARAGQPGPGGEVVHRPAQLLGGAAHPGALHRRRPFPAPRARHEEGAPRPARRCSWIRSQTALRRRAPRCWEARRACTCAPGFAASVSRAELLGRIGGRRGEGLPRGGARHPQGPVGGHAHPRATGC